MVQNCWPGVSVQPAGAEYVNEQWKEVRVCGGVRGPGFYLNYVSVKNNVMRVCE